MNCLHGPDNNNQSASGVITTTSFPLDWTISAYNTNNYRRTTYTDCLNERAFADGNGKSWAQQYIQQQAQGQILVSSAYSNTTENCYPGVDSATMSGIFTASNLTIASGLTYNPNDAQQVALNRLNQQLPSGYVWKNGAPAACSLSNSTPASGSTSFVVHCQRSDIAVYDWNAPSNPKAQLQAALAGKSFSAAQSICNNTPGVVPQSCAITPGTGGGSSMPTSASSIVIEPSIP